MSDEKSFAERVEEIRERRTREDGPTGRLGGLFGSRTAPRMEVVWEKHDGPGDHAAVGTVTLGDLGDEPMLVITKRNGQRCVVPVKRLIHAQEMDDE